MAETKTKNMFEITLWYIRSKPYIVFGNIGPSCLYDWRKVINDPTITSADVRVVHQWSQTLLVLSSGNFITINPPPIEIKTNAEKLEEELRSHNGLWSATAEMLNGRIDKEP
jgi:hypothetical protein